MLDFVSHRRTAVLDRIKRLSGHLSNDDRALLNRITEDHDYRMKTRGEPRGDLFIHWWYRDRRDNSALTSCETFHLNMLRYFNVMDIVDTIHIRCASAVGHTEAMDKAIGILSSGHSSVDFKVVEPTSGWEHDTFKEAVEHSIATGSFVYYIHFKGVSRVGDVEQGIAARVLRGSTDLDIYYWCYLMYMALFNAPTGVKAIGPLVHLGKNKSYSNRDISWSQLHSGDGVFHYCGSFQAFSGNYISECLRECGMGDADTRQGKLWVGDPYTVEMFLSMVSLKDDVYSLDVPYTQTNNIYHAYSNCTIPQYMEGFRSLYA